jgi:low temperature requirement protein LtrA
MPRWLLALLTDLVAAHGRRVRQNDDHSIGPCLATGHRGHRSGSDGGPEEREQRVTPLELFFDLVFVFASTQVTGFVSSAPSWSRLLEGLAILAVLWFAWSGYAWLGNTANTDEGLVRVLMFAAMGAMLVASLAVPHAFGADGLIFGVAYFVVRLLHIGCYAAVARAQHDARSRVSLRAWAQPSCRQPACSYSRAH